MDLFKLAAHPRGVIHRKSTILFDCVAVYLAYAEDYVETETVRFAITDDSFTVRDETSPFTARAALRWRDLPAFHTHLTRRLLGEECPARRGWSGLPARPRQCKTWTENLGPRWRSKEAGPGVSCD